MFKQELIECELDNMMFDMSKLIKRSNLLSFIRCFLIILNCMLPKKSSSKQL